MQYPLGHGSSELLQDPVIGDIAQAHGKSAAQVVLRWLRQEGIIAIPKSVHAQRIQENFAVDDFQLSPADMVQIQALDLGHSLILDVPSVSEVYRLHGIQFEQ